MKNKKIKLASALGGAVTPALAMINYKKIWN
jgi:hypothetical protein